MGGEQVMPRHYVKKPRNVTGVVQKLYELRPHRYTRPIDNSTTTYVPTFDDCGGQHNVTIYIEERPTHIYISFRRKDLLPEHQDPQVEDVILTQVVEEVEEAIRLIEEEAVK
jgi:hypothetical protein